MLRSSLSAWQPPGWLLYNVQTILRWVDRALPHKDILHKSSQPPQFTLDWGLSSSGVFSGLKIDLDTLVKKLDLDSRTIVSSGRGPRLRDSRAGESSSPGSIGSESGNWEEIIEPFVF
ncbi:hypothetical protein llap_9403 [Limosa lapponica baueri]|uniref:Uncharacterized protein n=1 Tax=Limosa lapponica baueri TaxID=1758121 RepID=A0A2I0U2Q6_LIMLA|nr:hypothetical protein llap_9403 [Limosa lapponica baueri]